jgi:hypothetical protein
MPGFEIAGKNFGRPDREAYLAAAIVYFAVMCYALSWSSSTAQEDRHHPS